MSEIEYGARDRFVSDDAHLLEKRESLTFADYFTTDDATVVTGFCYVFHDMGGMARYLIEFPSYNKDTEFTLTFQPAHEPTLIFWAKEHYNNATAGNQDCTWNDTTKSVMVHRDTITGATPLVLEIVCVE